MSTLRGWLNKEKRIQLLLLAVLLIIIVYTVREAITIIFHLCHIVLNCFVILILIEFIGQAEIVELCWPVYQNFLWQFNGLF